MVLSRRDLLKMGLGAGAVPLLGRVPAVASGADAPAPPHECLTARPLPLSSVRLTGGPLLHAQRLDAAYLLSLEPDRMLAYYRERAGLRTRAEPYGGWDGGGRNLTGHIAGHYLSAVSLMWAATGDARFKQRADYLVDQLKAVQDAHGDGYLCALEGGRRAFGELSRGEIRASSFDLNGEWSPWYTLHKMYAGLRDAYRYTGNVAALDVEIAFAEWAERVLAPLDDAQIQLMLDTEFGGMNEVLVDLYADTGDERWLELSRRFEHEAFIRPLRRQQDDLASTHGNTQVPKLIGSADRYVYACTPADLLAAAYFWERVAHHHSFVTGGHGTEEYFGPPDRLSGRIYGRTAESCNVYNMLKLTRRLFSISPDPDLADFQERALFNHILGSIDPEDGRTCYMVPVGPGVQHEYQDMQRSFTCCVGTGMESHALHGDGLYYASDDVLWVALYAPSVAEWSEAGLRLTMDTDFPEGETATLRLSLDEPRRFTLALRRPYWAWDGFFVTVNGEPATEAMLRTEADRAGRRPYDYADTASAFVRLTRVWRSGDVVEVALPKTLRLEPLADDPHRAAVLWGPLVLAGDLGPEGPRAEVEGEALGEPPPVPVIVAADRPVASWVERSGTAPIRFRTTDVGREASAEGGARDVDLVPFYRLHRRTYSIYWDLLTPAEWEARRAGYVRDAERRQRLEAATIAFVRPGDPGREREFEYRSGKRIYVQSILGRSGRRGGTWFSYDLPVAPDDSSTLIATYYSGDRRGMPAEFQILVNGTRVADEDLRLAEPYRFFDAAYPLPDEIVRNTGRVTVRFQAAEGSQITTVFGLRMIRGGEVP
jgi:uncharacterized protein